MDRDILRGIISEIEKELDNLNELRKEMKEIESGESIILKRSMGSILHDFYNCCERIFKKVAIEINGGYEDIEKWHKALLFKMTIPIKGLRPLVISEELAAELDEYLAFRHVFRNIYGFELKGERIGYLARKFDKVANRFIKDIKDFLSFLKKELMKLKTK
ncbi:MAG TPA: hypothetical protein VI387_02160 [Candidatus Brocadiales bacterium]|nr:hypothetical protein [Candidatus Brocadiales bacterium]